jgi:hypothetical protein
MSFVKAYAIIFGLFLLRTRNVSAKNQSETKTRILNPITFFPKVFAFIKYVKNYGRSRHTTDGYTIQHIRFACWIHNATDKHKYVTLCFSVSVCLSEGTSVLLSTYTSCYVSHPHTTAATSHFRILSVSFPSPLFNDHPYKPPQTLSYVALFSS